MTALYVPSETLMALIEANHAYMAQPNRPGGAATRYGEAVARAEEILGDGVPPEDRIH